MKIRDLFGPKVNLALQIAAVAMTAFSVYFFLRLDQVVHGDLYRYGLQFDYEWATHYWTYSRLIASFLGIAMVVTAISIAFMSINTRTQGTSSRLISCLLLIVGIVLIGFSAFFFNHLDYIVHHDLYRYGLQFSYEWVLQYWAYAKLVLGLLGFATATAVVSIALSIASTTEHEVQLLSRARTLFKVDPTKPICLVLFSTGMMALAFSIYYISSILAFIGLGLVFWGILLLYITPSKHVKLEVLSATVSSALANIEKVIVNSELNAKGIYLPPKYLSDFESSLIFIPKKAEQVLPKLEEVEEGKLLLENPNGMFLTPPGQALSKLFEKELGTSFMKTDLGYLKEMLPKLFTEDIEIAENIDVLIENNTITVEIRNHIFKDICEETRKHPKLQQSAGCPLCSAIACALAKATGKPIKIEKEEQSPNGRIMKIQYHILEE